MKPIRAHTGIFRDMQVLMRLARLKEDNPRLYDRVMEETLGGREPRVDESRRRFLKGSIGVAAGAMGLELLEGFYRPANGAGKTSVVNVAIVGAGIAGLNCAWQLRNRVVVQALASKGIALNVKIYEGRPNRTGGRMLTSTGDVAANMRCELGAEFVDSTNDDMFDLVQDPELGAICEEAFGHPLAMLDTGQDQAANKLIPQTLFIKGEPHRLEDAVEQLREIVTVSEGQMSAISQACESFKQESRGLTSCGGTGSLGFNNFGEASGVLGNRDITTLDATSAEDYINRLPIKEEWVKSYLETAYTTEYGIPLKDQSALGLVTLFGDQGDDQAKPQKKPMSHHGGRVARGHASAKQTASKPADNVDVFGPSDERFKVFGGNDKVVRCLTIALRHQIQMGFKLTAINTDQPKGTYTLSFDGKRAVSGVDLVVLACPFTMLSTVKFERGLDPEKFPRFARLNESADDFQPAFTPPADLSALGINSSKANTIDRVGYGRNMKVMAGFDRPVWREVKGGPFAGYTFSDEPFQMGWDSGECQDLATIPTARQRKIGTPKPGERSETEVNRAGFRTVPNQVIVKNRTLNMQTDGRQFSWFLGGGPNPAAIRSNQAVQTFAERILTDTRLRGFVTHTMDAQGVPGEGMAGKKVTDTQYKAIQEYMNAIVADTAKVYEGFVRSFDNQTRKMGRHATTSYIWTNDPFTRGSYLAYRLNQWTTMSGLEGAPLTFDGRQANFLEAARWTMFFAGEHCSGDYQGFMNGGAQTGRLAAQRILVKYLGLEAAKLTSPTEMTRLFLPTRRHFFVGGWDRAFGS